LSRRQRVQPLLSNIVRKLHAGHAGKEQDKNWNKWVGQKPQTLLIDQKPLQSIWQLES
jgi:hypothetical protein